MSEMTPADHAARGTKAVALTIRDQAERQCERQAAGHRSCEEAYVENGYANRCSRCAVLFVASQLTGRVGHVTADHVSAIEATFDLLDGENLHSGQDAQCVVCDTIWDAANALAALVAQAEAAREALLRQAEREEQNESQAKSEDDHRSAVIHGYCALKLRMLLAGGDSR